MKFNRIKVENFKSFDVQELCLNEFNILVGSNASGKSNTVSIFRFIDNIISLGIDNAISLSGGVNYLFNGNIGKSKPLSISFEIDFSDDNSSHQLNKKLGFNFRLMKINYEFKIEGNKRGSGFKIAYDYMNIEYEVFKNDNPKSDELISETNQIHKCSISMERKTGKSLKIIPVIPSEIVDIDKNNMFDAKYWDFIFKDRKNDLFLSNIRYILPFFFFAFDFIKIYDFDPKMLKKPASITSIISLDEDGSNLPNILQDLLKNNESKRKLRNLLIECLPFIQSITVENNIDKSISYKIKEIYNNKEFYSNFLSDGTVNILALIVAMYFQSSNSIICIEEPEKNLHPKLMSKIIDLARENNMNNQFIFTTHSPELVRYSRIEDLYFASRCEKGFTTIKKPIESNDVKIFLQNDLNIVDIFIDDLLGI